MALKIVPEPQGFKLRDKRSDKSGSAQDWLPEDALHDASREIAKNGVDGPLVVMWYTNNPNGKPIARFRAFYSDSRIGRSLLHETQQIFHETNR